MIKKESQNQSSTRKEESIIISQSYAKSPAAERKFTTREMVLVGMFAAVLAVLIAIPSEKELTMQETYTSGIQNSKKFCILFLFVKKSDILIKVRIN